MARKPTSRKRTPAPGKDSSITDSIVLRNPQKWRVVTARKLPPNQSDRKRGTAREVPEIRLSGAWLKHVGFPKNRRYMISADRPFETLILQADPMQAKPRRRR